jgi:3-hydroxyisobutyrate dehydrogenase
MRVAWIGLGHMGLPTARLVAAAGHEVRGYDIKPPCAQDAQGLVLCASPREAATGCDIVCLAVFSDEQAEEVLCGPEGLFAILEPGAVVAIFTTGTIDSARKLTASAPPGISVLDTCFSRAGSMTSDKLNLLVGGDADALQRCMPVLDTFAAETFHLGASGAGRAMKLVNNLLWVGNNRLLIDALDLAAALGFDRHEAARIIDQCTGGSRVTEMYTRPYDDMVAYMRPFMVKDASAAAEAAREAGADLGTLGHVVREYLQ